MLAEDRQIVELSPFKCVCVCVCVCVVCVLWSRGHCHKVCECVAHLFSCHLLRSIEDVAHFSGLLQRRQLTYGAKQLISREVCVCMSVYVCM